MAFEIPFIQASRCFTGADSYTILKTKKLERLVEGLASVLIARHNGVQ